MTNQEIYADLGDMGTLILLYLEMAGADGETTEDEVLMILKAASCFTDKDVTQFFEGVFKVKGILSFDERLAYLKAGLSYFAENIPADTKKNILHSLTLVAGADGNIHDNESALYKLAYSYLNA
jgi:hypothetical protein